jgi:uncharacterized protein (DUF2336 family)
MKFSASNPLDSLVDLACRDGVDIRPTLLRVVTDLYVQKPVHGLEEETQFVELALGLIDAADASTRAAVLARLSAYPGAPAAVLQRLAGGSPAGTGSGGEPEEPKEPVRDNLIELFFSAASEERRLILVNLDVASDPPVRRGAPVAGELTRRLEIAALKRNQAEFIRVLERAVGVSHALAERIACDNSGEPLVVAAKSLGIKAEVLQRILLFLNPVIGQSAKTLYELSRLYDELNPAAAERMVSIWRTAAPRPPVHAPVYWNDERPALRPAARPAANRAPSRDERPARSRSNER